MLQLRCENNLHKSSVMVTAGANQVNFSPFQWTRCTFRLAEIWPCPGHQTFAEIWLCQGHRTFLNFIFASVIVFCSNCFKRKIFISHFFFKIISYIESALGSVIINHLLGLVYKTEVSIDICFPGERNPAFLPSHKNLVSSLSSKIRIWTVCCITTKVWTVCCPEN